ncbi:hypothetical protein [Phocaeicola sp.]
MEDNLFIEYINSPYKEPQDMLPKIDETMLADMEDDLEADFKNEYQQEDAASILESIEYIRLYCRNFPCFNGFDYQPLQAPFAYYRSREIYLRELPFTEDEFYKFTYIQDAIKKLGLKAQPTFEFMAFLYYIIKVWSENQITTSGAKIDNILTLLKEQPKTKLAMNIKVGSKSFEFTNSLFIQSLLEFYSSHDLISHDLVEQENKRVRERTIQYSLVKTLLDYLPIKVDKSEDTRFVQAERNLALCALYLCKLLMGDPAYVCTKDNNATFDKLMRDFKDFNITLYQMLT